MRNVRSIGTTLDEDNDDLPLFLEKEIVLKGSLPISSSKKARDIVH